MKNVTTWERLVIIINKLKEKNAVLKYEFMTKICLKEYYHIDTMNNYRNQFTRLGYLKRIGPGCYEIIKKIPSSLSSGKAWELLCD